MVRAADFEFTFPCASLMGQVTEKWQDGWVFKKQSPSEFLDCCQCAVNK